MRRERLFLEDILAATEAIAEFIRGQSVESFIRDRLVRSAVMHQLTIIGEAVARLPPELRERYAQIPWADIKGFRNVIVHHYFGIDWEEVWRSATVRVPVLSSQIAAILQQEFPE
jgi:uncharacterized protein with HEPN domain